MKKHNFYAGPSILSEYTIKNTANAIIDFANTGLSVLEISHRSKEFQAVIDEASALVKELLEVPEGYSVLWLGGGASMQFCMLPFNLLKTKASYLDTGTWASNAIKEARLFGEVDVVASSKDANYTFIPKGYEISADSDYFHFTSNNTIYGTEMRFDPDAPCRLIADMSSDIFSRPIDMTLSMRELRKISLRPESLLLSCAMTLSVMSTVRSPQCSTTALMSKKARCSTLPPCSRSSLRSRHCAIIR